MTSSPSWSILSDLFSTALELAPDERSAYLDIVCDGDPALRADIDSLLAADARMESEDPTFLSTPLSTTRSIVEACVDQLAMDYGVSAPLSTSSQD